MKANILILNFLMLLRACHSNSLRNLNNTSLTGINENIQHGLRVYKSAFVQIKRAL